MDNKSSFPSRNKGTAVHRQTDSRPVGHPNYALFSIEKMKNLKALFDLNPGTT